MENSKTVVIPAAGLGERLGDFTKNYSKAMVTLGKMPIISYIINKFTNDDEIIILLGYKGDLLKQVVKACHPDRNITFVDVDNYCGEGSGLGYSLHCAYSLLQKPFIFWSCDSVLEDFDVNSVDYSNNWSVVSSLYKEQFTNYRHMQVDSSSHVINILPKDVKYQSDIYSYTGVSFIKDYAEFWDSYARNTDAFIKTGETYGLVNLKSLNAIFTDKWIDAGCKEILERAKLQYSSMMSETILEKPDEAIWFIGNKVIKFHINEKFISDRVKRYSTMLCDKQVANGIMLPKMLYSSKNVYVYERANGVIASKVITPDMMIDILDKYLDVDYVTDLADEDKVAIYDDFYRKKTLSRIKKYCDDNADIDNKCIINGLACEPATTLIEQINWDELPKIGVFTNNYHGDFHLENILVNNGKYVMLDWRQNFGKTYVGDAYYDIAKMWHSLIVNHTMVKDNLFDVQNISKNEIRIDIHRTFIDTECEKALVEYINSSMYDYDLSELMTAIIFLNIAACHIYPYSKFLFYLGKYMINKFYNKHIHDTKFFKQ